VICCTATLGLPLETLRIAVVAAGMQAPACHPAPAWQATVASIEEALAVARAQADGRAVEIVLAAGVHRIERSVRIGRDDPVALIAGCEGARVVGGWVDAAPAWEVPPAEAITAVDAQARPQVRAWRLPGHVRERLAGPVHSGHGIETAAVHSEVFVGGRALVPARWPNNDANGGYAAIGELVDPGRDAWRAGRARMMRGRSGSGTGTGRTSCCRSRQSTPMRAGYCLAGRTATGWRRGGTSS